MWTCQLMVAIVVAAALLAFPATTVAAAQAQEETPQLVQLQPITREQYEAILGLAEGKPVISEGRLIASGLAALRGLAVGLTSGWTESFGTGLLPSIISNLVRTHTNETQTNATAAYPLCVISSDDSEHAEEDARDDDADMADDSERPPQKVNCVVVVREPEHKPPRNDVARPAVSPLPYNWNPPPASPFPAVRYSYPWQWYYPSYNPPFPYYAPLPAAHFAPLGNLRYFDMAPPIEVHRYDTSSGNSRRHTAAGKHRKRPRAMSSAPLNYAKVSSYPVSGYETAAYPQTTYQSGYPKATYTHASSFAAPVYVRARAGTDGESIAAVVSKDEQANS